MKNVLPKPTILQLDEYDVNQRVIEALTNVCSHAVLFSIVDKAKDAGEISNDLQISISNVYKTLMNLEKLERFLKKKNMLTPVIMTMTLIIILKRMKTTRKIGLDLIG